MGSEYSLSDIAAATGKGNNGFGDSSGWWIILLLLALGGGYGGFGGGYGGFGGAANAFNNDFAWLSNGQKEIMQNTNQGFDTLQLANSLNGLDSGVQNLATQICTGFANTNQTISNGFAGAEIAANNRQMADMQQAFNAQTTTLNGFNNLNNALQNCCCENRLATSQTQNIIQSEAGATRLANQNNTQAILDKLCQLELDNVKTQLDAKNDRISELQRELSMKDLQASQIAQNSFIAQGFANEVDQLYNRLSNCPVPTTPVYGRTPIFTCNNNGGCGCGGNSNVLF